MLGIVVDQHRRRRIWVAGCQVPSRSDLPEVARAERVTVPSCPVACTQTTAPNCRPCAVTRAPRSLRARLGQRLADHGSRQRGARHHTQRRACQHTSPLGMKVWPVQPADKPSDLPKRSALTML